MEKVKATQKQAEWLDKYVLTQAQIDHYIDAHSYKKRPDSPIADWGSSKVARALYVGYEVESKLKVGDWAVHDNGSIGKVIDISESLVIVTIDALAVSGNNINTYAKYFRHATPEEIAEEKTRRWWEKHGRDVWELKQGDILWDLDLNECVTANHEGLIPQNIRRLYKVICFVEDRKDL